MLSWTLQDSGFSYTQGLYLEHVAQIGGYWAQELRWTASGQHSVGNKAFLSFTRLLFRFRPQYCLQKRRRKGTRGALYCNLYVFCSI
ncbi:hypothetical protein SERLA73DRAFT_191636, partial [Serpula lacrymans var. lacrymans S7.3]